MARLALRLSGAPLVLFVLCSAALAKDPDRTQFGRDIRVEAGEKTGDLTCINCSIYVRGGVTGDVTALHGNIVLENGASVAGDATAVWGNIRVESGAQLVGDVTSIAGAVRRQPQATVSGDVTSLEGGPWILAILVPPLLVVGLIVALVIWLAQRGRRRVAVPA